MTRSVEASAPHAGASCCEQCWSDSGGSLTQYSVLVERRACTPEQQAGPDAGECPKCARKTLHQHTGEPMCGCPREAA